MTHPTDSRAAEAMREACAKEIDRPLNNGESWHIADKISRTRLGHLSGDEIRAIKVFAELRAANVRALTVTAAPAHADDLAAKLKAALVSLIASLRRNAPPTLAVAVLADALPTNLAAERAQDAAKGGE